MKKYLLLLILFLIPLNVFAVSDVDYEITHYKIDATIKTNGDLDVCEYIEQTGSYNGYVRDIFYKDGDSNYTPIGISNLTVYDLVSMSKGEEFKYDNYAMKGDRLKYKTEESYNGISVTMYNENDYGAGGYVLCYSLRNAVLIHNDVAELYYNFIPNGFQDRLERVSVRVNLPEIDDTLRVWAHGELNGNVSKASDSLNSYLYASIDYINPGNVLNVRMTFNKDLIKSSTRFTYMDELDNIIEEETRLADEANRERQKAKNIIMLGILSFVGYVSFVIYAVIKTYVRYDKEHNVDFDMEYYRDFPNSYGPEFLEYLIKRKNTTDSYSASILNMIYKKAILVEATSNKKDYILTKSEIIEDSLTDGEKMIFTFLFDEIGNGNSVSLSDIKKYGKKESTATKFLTDFNNWKQEIERESTKYNFFEERKNGTLGALVIIFTILNFFIGNLTEIFITSFLGIFIGVFASIYIFNSSKRTKEGMLEYKKWMAFKKFLVDFGRFDEKELPEIILWEKYLVFATVLGVADKLEKTMKIKIESLNTGDLTTGDMIFMNLSIRNDFASTMSRSITNAYTTSRSTIAASQSSSGGGTGGGFSGGGSFSGGGGGGGGHGF